MSVLTSPWFLVKLEYPDNRAMSGGMLYTYTAGSNVPKSTYLDPEKTIAAPNPLVADADGVIPQYYPGLGLYKMVIADQYGTVIYTRDYIGSETGGDTPVTGVTSVFGRDGDVNALPSDYTPTFIGAEPDLGKPSSDGSLLVSTTAGIRSWVGSGDIDTAQDTAKVTGLHGKQLPTLGTTALLRYNGTDWIWDGTVYQPNASNLDDLADAKGNGFFRRVNNVWTMDESTYLTQNQNITVSGDVTGNGSTSIDSTVVGIRGYSIPSMTNGRLKYVLGSGLIWESSVPLSTGVIGPTPTYVRNTDSIEVSSFDCYLYPNSIFKGDIIRYTIPAKTFNSIPRDGVTRYIAVDYNNGNPILNLYIDKAFLNGSSIVTVAFIWNIDGSIHLTESGNAGEGLSNKLRNQSIQTQPYQRSIDGGLTLSEDGARHIGVTSSVVYAGGTAISVPGYGSANTNHKLTLAYHVAGVLTYSTVVTGGQYNNTQYDNGTDLVSMGPSKYAVRWIYRSIGDDVQIFYVLGTGEYNSVAQAQQEGLRVIPNIMRDHCMLVGRIIVQNGANSGVVESAFNVAFGASAIQDHAQLANLNSTNYYHLTQASHTDLTDGGSTDLHKHDNMAIDGGSY